MHVLRVYHAGRDAAHRARERALVSAGVEVTLVVPSVWPGSETELSPAPFRIVELDVRRPGDVNRHHNSDEAAIREVLADVRPDVLDLHEEPFSAAARHWLRAAPLGLPIVMYTAQNVDKRLPPPFHQWERSAYRRVSALYPCSRQAASVARGKGFSGRIDVLPLGFDPEVFSPGAQSSDGAELVLAFAGRLVAEKGVVDAVRVLAAVAAERPARLVVCGDGRALDDARSCARSLGVGDRVEFAGSRQEGDLAAVYRAAHVVLVLSRPTATWTEQFGRVIVEAQASGAVVAGYDTGSIAEVGGEPALLAPTGDVDEVAARVLALASGPADFERRSRAGVELSAQRTWTRVAEAQAQQYRDVLTRAARASRPSSSLRERRRAAIDEFGQTAATTSGIRPFAVPLLRAGGPLTRLLGVLCDWVGEAIARTGLMRD